METITVAAPGIATWGAKRYRCALGAGGITSSKREGDGATPVGCFALRYVLYRADRMGPPVTGLRLETIAPDDGWCDDSPDPNYNRPVTLPYPGRTERLQRDDEIYDVVVVLGHNDDPVVPGDGSAIFLHVARADYAPTAGCVALTRPDLFELLAGCGPKARLRVVG
jgi:L,D-peptidoglycan transpeptidase YkuD (ErfK/YbiS/YcfS/YnhG family)